MPLVYSYSTSGSGSPTMDVDIYMGTSRSGDIITVVATAVCSFRYDDGFLTYPPNYAVFNVGTPTDSKNVYIMAPSSDGKSYTWRASSEKTRQTTVSVTYKSTGNKVNVAFSITGAPGQVALISGGEHSFTLDAPDFVAPSAPTWTNINPNPCSINSAPLITWGGATAGSISNLYYDLQIRSSTPSGGWTEWTGIFDARETNSYQSPVLNTLNIRGQKPYVGVQYQYRVRTSDAQYSTSAWVYSATLSVSFGSPTAPDSYTLSATRIKKGGKVTVSWTRGSGGAGSISSYYLEVRTYNHTTGTWSGWSQIYSGGQTSYTYSNSNLANNDLIQFRIRLRNSWGQYSSYLTTSNVTVKSNQMWTKINGTWKEGEVYIKIDGTWRSGAPYIKVNGTWKESI